MSLVERRTLQRKMYFINWLDYYTGAVLYNFTFLKDASHKGIYSATNIHQVEKYF